MSKKTGLEMATAIKQALADASMPRTSKWNGGEVNGWTTHVGSTGFSLRSTSEGQLDWHVVVSGKPLLRYREYTGRDGEHLHEPINPETLCPRLKTVFEGLGLTVHGVRYASHQTMWDDDVGFNILTDHPEWLEAGPGAGGWTGWGTTVR